MKVSKLILIVMVMVLFSVPLLIFAQSGGTIPGQNPAPLLKNPLGNDVDSIFEFVKVVLENIVMPIGAVVVVFFIIYSGYLFVTAGGDETKLKKAKQTFLWVIVGAAVLLGAWAISLAIKNTVCQIAPASWCNTN